MGFKKGKGKKSMFAKVLPKGHRLYEMTKRINKRLEEDEIFYEECFNNSDHTCEECGEQLNTDFRDEEGRIIARWRYSHIIPKSIAPEIRHEISNINNLCLFHHQKWENGDREGMRIYQTNKVRKKIAKYFSD